jgi:hypothetical protein
MTLVYHKNARGDRIPKPAAPFKVTAGVEPHTLFLFFLTADGDIVKRVARTAPARGRKPR